MLTDFIPFQNYGQISLKKYREQMAANMKAPTAKRRRGKFKCKKYKGKFYWYRDSPAEQRKFLRETKANKLRSRIMPEHKQLIHASLRSKKQLTEEQLTYGRILASNKYLLVQLEKLPQMKPLAGLRRTTPFSSSLNFMAISSKVKSPWLLLEVPLRLWKYAGRRTSSHGELQGSGQSKRDV